MTTNLDELKKRLYVAFDAAADWQETNTHWYNTADKNVSRAQNFQAIALLAQAIIAVETKIEESEQSRKSRGLKG